MKKEWKIIFYEDEKGCPVKDFVLKLDAEEKKKIMTNIEYLEEVGFNLRRPQGDYLRDGIYELRVTLSGNNTRTLYFFCYETNIVLTHTFVKKHKKCQKKEIEKAIKCKEIFLQKYNKIA